MAVTYKGRPIYFTSSTERKAFAAALSLLMPIGILQTIAAGVGIAILTGLPAPVVVLVLMVLSVELTFQGGTVVRCLPAFFRRNLVWIDAPLGALGFYLSSTPGAFWPTVLGVCLAYRMGVSIASKLLFCRSLRRDSNKKFAEGLAECLGLIKGR